MDSLALRYARALFSIAKDEKKVLAYKEAMNYLEDYFVQNSEVDTYLKSYFVSEKDKYDVIDKITKQFELVNLSSFIKLLVKKHRFDVFRYIEKEFIKLANEELGIYSGIVYSTIPLSKKEIASIEEAISIKEKQKVELINKIDEKLIGGVKVAIADKVYDGSVKNKLEILKSQLSERRTINEY